MKKVKEQKKMTPEEFQKKIKKWGWICNYIPHNYVSADNKVVSGCAMCLRCGNITTAKEAGLPPKISVLI